MPDDLPARVARADVLADAICARRLINALLSTVAVWLLSVLLARREFLDVGGAVWFAVATAITFLMVAFSAWAFVFGDRRAWARAVHGSPRIERDSSGE